MKQDQRYLFSKQIQEAYNQSKLKVESMLEKKYEFVRSVFAEDLAAGDEKTKARFFRAKNEEQFILSMLHYLENFEEMEKLLRSEKESAIDAAEIWNKAYQASITENLEFTKLILSKKC